MKAATRIDIPTVWRAVLRRLLSPQGGGMVSIVPPREVPPGMPSRSWPPPWCRHRRWSPVRARSTLIEFAVAALNALSGPASTGEWQWTVRAEETLPR